MPCIRRLLHRGSNDSWMKRSLPRAVVLKKENRRMKSVVFLGRCFAIISHFWNSELPIGIFRVRRRDPSRAGKMQAL